MSTPARRRLLRDLSALNKHEDASIYAQPLDNDMLTWVAVIMGPAHTVYEKGTFSLVLTFGEDYPNHPPEVSFISEMFHPNIYPHGDLCMDLLKTGWSPSYDILGILLSIQSLLNDPNTGSPANAEAARLFEEDLAAYQEKVRETVEKSWLDVEMMLEKVAKNKSRKET